VITKFCDLYFPTAFTPNRDGKNDYFKILYAYNLSEYHLVIYNLWGQKIFETRDPSHGWDGNLGGQLQQTAVFTWFCDYTKKGSPERIRMKGTVALIR
jgi:gliding motility-associated-like protein